MDTIEGAARLLRLHRISMLVLGILSILHNYAGCKIIFSAINNTQSFAHLAHLSWWWKSARDLILLWSGKVGNDKNSYSLLLKTDELTSLVKMKMWASLLQKADPLKLCSTTTPHSQLEGFGKFPWLPFSCQFYLLKISCNTIIWGGGLEKLQYLDCMKELCVGTTVSFKAAYGSFDD